MEDVALTKLHNILGEEKAAELVRETLREIGIADLKSPNDRLRFAEALMLRGGVIEAIGRAIKIQALLHGAKT